MSDEFDAETGFVANGETLAGLAAVEVVLITVK